MAQPAATGGPQPVLRIETGLHLARSADAGIDREGRVLVTVADDKTGRVWSLPDLRPLGVLRLPIGEGHEGKPFAVAVSPDGRTAALGGWSQGATHDVLVFDLATRQVVRRYPGMPTVIDSLAYSPDGARLAVGLAAEEGIRVLDVANGNVLLSDRQYRNAVYGLAFGQDGRLAAAGGDGSVRLYDRALRMPPLRQPTVVAQEPFRLRFSPDGTMLAVGFVDRPGEEVRDATTLAVRARPNVAGLPDGTLPRVGWSPDSRTLYAGGSPWQSPSVPIFGWKNAGSGGRYLAAPGFEDSIASIMVLPDGSIALTSLAGDVGVAAADGRRLATRNNGASNLNRPPRDITAESWRLRLSGDGTVVQWVVNNAQDRILRFNATTTEFLENVPPLPGLQDWAAEAGALRATDWLEGTAPKLNGRRLELDQHEIIRSVAVANNRVLVGADWTLRMFDDQAKPLWPNPVQLPGAGWRVNQSADGRLAVAALGDGTIRWYRADNGRELLAFFMTPDMERWVAFTPGGYYAASAGGEDLIGWHLNRAPDQAADFFGASRFRDRYYRPDVVQQVLRSLDETVALRLANLARGAQEQRTAAAITEDLPPVVAILSPSDSAQLGTGEVQVEFSLRSPSGRPVRELRVLIDGRPAPATRGLERLPTMPAGMTESRGRVAVDIPAGRTVEVALIAVTETRASEPARVRVVGMPQAPAAQAVSARTRPALYALIVGVSEYSDPELKLGFAAKDATDMAALLQAQQGSLYREVQVQLLTDARATREAVVDGLDWLRRQATANDVAVVFLAGHGANDATDRFFFLPATVDRNRLRSTAVSGLDLQDALRNVPGRVLALMDTCHSGNVLGSGFRSGMADIDRLSNELAAAESGLIVFASSTGRQLSREMPQLQNGAFTAALQEALRGGADLDRDGAITLAELDFFVLQRVKQMTNGEQHPNMLRPESIRDFPLAVVR